MKIYDSLLQKTPIVRFLVFCLTLGQLSWSGRVSASLQVGFILLETLLQGDFAFGRVLPLPTLCSTSWTLLRLILLETLLQGISVTPPISVALEDSSSLLT